MIQSLCQWLSSWLPSITIPQDNGKPYLTRYYLFGADRQFGNIFLHHFHSSDLDRSRENGSLLLHDHPFWGVSLILIGGYDEERCLKSDLIVRCKTFLPWSINIIRPNCYHRVDLLQSDGWSLFITGPRSKRRSWGFWDRITKEYKDFREFAKAVP